MAKDRAVGVFDEVVAELCDNPDMITENNKNALMQLLREIGAFVDQLGHDGEEGADGNGEGLDITSLRAMLGQQQRLLTRMNDKVRSSGDIADMKAVAAANRQLFDLIAKYEEKALAQDRARHIETAMVGALHELADDRLTNLYKQRLYVLLNGNGDV